MIRLLPYAILAVDPGVTTGLATGSNGVYATGVVHLTDLKEFYNMIYTGLWDLVAVEQFQTANVMSRYGLRTAELVGATEALCWARGIQCIRRTPQHRIPFLRRANILLKDKRVVDHEVDALAHLLSAEKLIADGKLKLDSTNNTGGGK